MNEANAARSSRARAGDPLPPRSSFLAGRSRGPGTSCPWCSGCSRGPGPKPVGPQVGAGAGAVRTRGNSRLLLASEGPPPGAGQRPRPAGPCPSSCVLPGEEGGGSPPARRPGAAPPLRGQRGTRGAVLSTEVGSWPGSSGSRSAL